MKLPSELEFPELLKLLINPKAAGEYLAKLDALADEISLQIEIKGTVDEIKRLRDVAQHDKDQAAHLMDVTRDEALRILEDAKTAANAERELAVEGAKRLEAERESFATFHKLECDTLKAREDTCGARERELAGAQERVAGKTAWAERVTKEYKDKLTRLKEFTSQA